MASCLNVDTQFTEFSNIVSEKVCVEWIQGGVLLRGLEMRVINRRHYHVAGPQCLWHIDGNHKLIRLVLYCINCS